MSGTVATVSLPHHPYTTCVKQAVYLSRATTILGIALLVLGALAVSGRLSPKVMSATFMGVGAACAITQILAGRASQQATLSHLIGESMKARAAYIQLLAEKGADDQLTIAAKVLSDEYTALVQTQTQRVSSVAGTALKIVLALVLIGAIGSGVLRGRMSFKVPAGIAMAIGGLSLLGLLCGLATRLRPTPPVEASAGAPEASLPA